MNSYDFQYDPSRDFSQILDLGALACPDRTAVVCGQTHVTYAQLNRRVDRLASALREAADGKPLKAAIISRNSIPYMELFFACARAGITAVNINWRCTVREQAYLLRHTGCRLVFSQAEDPLQYRDLAQNLDPGVRLIRLTPGRTGDTSQYETFLASGSRSLPRRTVGSGDIFTLYHTSGSSGIPKAVVFTHQALLAKIRLMIRGEGFEKHLVFQAMTQMFHAGSLGNYMCLACLGTLVLFSHFDPEAYLASIQRERVNRITVAPSTLRTLLGCPGFQDYDLSSLTTINYSMAPMPLSLISQALGLLPGCTFMEIYGMTELAGGVTVLNHQDHISGVEGRRASVGRPMEGMEVRIVGEDRQDCAPGQTGEIALRGPGMMREYYLEPEATRLALEDGWFFSNDMGYLTPDGYLHLAGRRSTMIITGGENVFPKEVEDILLEHDNVKEAAVFGIPDETWGERVCACVVAWHPEQFDEASLKAFCRSRTAGYKTPKTIFLADHLPRNSVGKVLHRLLTQRYGGQPEREPDKPPETL